MSAYKACIECISSNLRRNAEAHYIPLSFSFVIYVILMSHGRDYNKERIKNELSRNLLNKQNEFLKSNRSLIALA